MYDKFVKLHKSQFVTVFSEKFPEYSLFFKLPVLKEGPSSKYVINAGRIDVLFFRNFSLSARTFERESAREHERPAIQAANSRV